MKQEEAKSIFILAGIQPLAFEALIDGYGFGADDNRLYEEPLRCVWWFVKTSRGWVKIGWRKRVINIDWTHTDIRKKPTEDDVTKYDNCVHAWSIEKAIEYVRNLFA